MHLDERVVGLDPPPHLRDVDLVAPGRPGHVGVDLEEERCPADEARRVVGADAEREVAVTVRRCDGCHHERIARSALHEVVDLREVVGDEVDGALVEARPRDVREEVRHVAQAIAEVPCIIGRSRRACIWCTSTRSRRSACLSTASRTVTGSPLEIGTIRSASGPMWSMTASGELARRASRRSVVFI